MNYWVIGIVAFLLLDLVLVFVVLWKKRSSKKFKKEELHYMKSHWFRIIDSFEKDMRGAILDADKLLDYALSRKGFVGSLGEKLKKAGPRCSDLNGTWSAHKLRNRVAHELDEISSYDAKTALKQFKKALNDLGTEL